MQSILSFGLLWLRQQHEICWATYTDHPFPLLWPSQSNRLFEILGHICVPRYLRILCFWALYLTHNLYIGLHIQTVILKYWALNVDHYSSLSPIIWAIYMQTIFIIGFCGRRNMQLSILGYIYVPFYSSIPNLLGFIYSPLFLIFSFFF